MHFVVGNCYFLVIMGQKCVGPMYQAKQAILCVSTIYFTYVLLPALQVIN